MTVSARLAELGLQLPPVARPVAAYVPAARVGSQIWTSGQLPTVDGALVATGKLGEALSVDDGVDAARTATLNALAAVSDVAGGIDRIRSIVKVVVYVASDSGFTQQPAVANGASKLLGDLFGPSGAHVRIAVGVSVLPLDAPVEIELIVEADELG